MFKCARSSCTKLTYCDIYCSVANPSEWLVCTLLSLLLFDFSTPSRSANNMMSMYRTEKLCSHELEECWTINFFFVDFISRYNRFRTETCAVFQPLKSYLFLIMINGYQRTFYVLRRPVINTSRTKDRKCCIFITVKCRCLPGKYRSH